MKREGGSVGVVVAVLAAFVVILSLLLVDVAHVVAARASLTTAADAAALAAAPVTFASFGTTGSPTLAAVEMAAANGVELVYCACDTDTSWSTRQVSVTVGVTVDLVLLGDRRLTATAAAEFSPVALGLTMGTETAVRR